MSSTRIENPQSYTNSEPTWEVARLFPNQGSWSEEEYLAINTNRLIEFSHGQLDVLSMPTHSHQAIVAYLYGVLLAFTQPLNLGTLLFAPLRLRLWPGKYREPDLLFVLTEHSAKCGEEYWESADLVVEVVSYDDRRRDIEIKRFEYARAGIPEYWIVDPQRATISVLRLESGKYIEHGVFGSGTKASSVLLAGFSVEVDAVLAHAKL